MLYKLVTITEARLEKLNDLCSEIKSKLSNQQQDEAYRIITEGVKTEQRPAGVLPEAGYAELVQSNEKLNKHLDKVYEKLRKDERIARIRARRVPFELRSVISSAMESLRALFAGIETPDAKYG